MIKTLRILTPPVASSQAATTQKLVRPGNGSRKISPDVNQQGNPLLQIIGYLPCSTPCSPGNVLAPPPITFSAWKYDFAVVAPGKRVFVAKKTPPCSPRIKCFQEKKTFSPGATTETFPLLTRYFYHKQRSIGMESIAFCRQNLCVTVP